MFSGLKSLLHCCWCCFSFALRMPFVQHLLIAKKIFSTIYYSIWLRRYIQFRLCFVDSFALFDVCVCRMCHTYTQLIPSFSSYSRHCAPKYYGLRSFNQEPVTFSLFGFCQAQTKHLSWSYYSACGMPHKYENVLVDFFFSYLYRQSIERNRQQKAANRFWLK